MEAVRAGLVALHEDERWAKLQSSIQGRLIAPDDPGYDEARTGWDLNVQQWPAAIVIALEAEDVAQAVRFAAEEGLPVTVQSTGHGTVRAADNSLLIITSEMAGVWIDATRQTAWVGAGAKWGMVLAESQRLGLAPLLGSSPDVGVVGYTLGGGYGWLGRKYGLSADSVRSFDLVTADGEMRKASEAENSDLFWGLRGGGGSLAIVTGMEIQLYPVSTVYGGNLFYPIELAKEVLQRYRDWIASAPDDLTSSVVLMNFPPIPEVPEVLRGQSFVMVRGCYCGPVEQGEALVQGWRAWRAPVIDDFKVMPFADVATISNDPVDPSPVFTTGAWLHELSDGAIDLLIEHVPARNGPSPLIFAELRHVGGAVSRVEAGSSAYGNRKAPLLLHLLSMAPTPDAFRRLQQYTDDLKQALQPSLTGGVYLNFLSAEESRRRVADGYSPESFHRLKALKARYDPENRLQHGFDIGPTP
jgi:FAD/FMN-containing dehydrogenase